jgi:integrase
MSSTRIEAKIDLHIRPVWRGRLASSITSDEFRDYRASRKAADAEDATINKEIGFLRSAYIHGYKRQSPKKKVLGLPYFPMVKVTTKRTGFVDVADYDGVMQEHCASLKPFWMLAYHSGCRSGELKNLDWQQVQFDTKVVELEPGTTKNDEGRYLPFYGDMEVMLLKQKELADKLNCKAVLFWHPEDQKLGTHCVPGTRINSCRKLWDAALRRAGLAGVTPHDLRRSAVRNMVQKCGISESQAMKIVSFRQACVTRCSSE